MGTRAYIVLSVLAILLGGVGNLYAQVSFDATTDRPVVSAGQQFRLTYTLNTTGSNFTPPPIGNFDILSGPNPTTSMRIINGSMSQSMKYDFILRARETGKFTIPAASIVVNGKTYQSNTVTIEVTKGAPPSKGQQDSQTEQANANDLFAKLQVNKRTAYVGEAIQLDHKIYTRLNLVGFNDVKYPQLNGFMTYDIEIPPRISMQNERVGNVMYRAGDMKKNILFAQRAGQLRIEPMEVECVVREQAQRRPRTFFDQFWGMGYQDIKYQVKSNPLQLAIKPLPEAGKPEDFKGAVGSYSFRASIDKEKVKANEAINLKVTITGNGNLKLIDAPEIVFPGDFEIYDPRISENINTGNAGVTGSKSFEYVLIPRHAGTFTIEPVRFSYFNPDKASYVSLTSPEFQIEVEKGEGNDTGPVIAGANKADIQYLGNDIRFIKTGPVELTKKGHFFFGSASFYTLFATPFLAFLLLVAVRKKQQQEQGDMASLKSRKATKIARKRLVHAHKMLKSNNREAYYEEMLKALWGYISDKLKIDTAHLNKEQAKTTLLAKGVEEQVIDKLTGLIDKCEYARYAPQGSATEMEDMYQHALGAIRKIEETVK